MEILFKGKRLSDGEWKIGDLFYSIRGAYISNRREPDTHEVDRNTICQFTGLTDKHGNKIWTGDIVRYQFDTDDCPFPNKHTEKIIGRVFFSDWRASFSVTAGRNGSSMMNNDLFKYVRNGNRVEVIGNIFDNPELLEVDDD